MNSTSGRCVIAHSDRLKRFIARPRDSVFSWASTVRTFRPASSFCTPSVTILSPSPTPEVTSAASSVKEATVTGCSTSAPDALDHVDRRAGAAVENGRERQPRDLGVGRVRQRHGRGHAEGDRVVRVLDGEARRIGAGGGVGLRRELAQPRLEAAVAIGPQPHRRLGLRAPRASQVSGSATTASFSPRWASRTTAWPMATT